MNRHEANQLMGRGAAEGILYSFAAVSLLIAVGVTVLLFGMAGVLALAFVGVFCGLGFLIVKSEQKAKRDQCWRDIAETRIEARAEFAREADDERRAA